MAMHGHVAQSQAGIAVILTSISSALINLPLVQRQAKLRSQMRELVLSSALQAIIGIAILFLQVRVVRLL
jgi:Kef-type K+ transport system membrane component KefB